MPRFSLFASLAVAVAAGLALVSCAPPKGADGLAAVIVKQPVAFTKVASPLHVTGTADVFEATFRLQVVDAVGHVLVDRQVMATCGTGCRGTFDTTLTFTASGRIKLIAYELSSKDSSRIELASLPLTT